jgi:hypothetical protein
VALLANADMQTHAYTFIDAGRDKGAKGLRCICKIGARICYPSL